LCVDFLKRLIRFRLRSALLVAIGTAGTQF
jgi:hypothetical protein